MHGWLASWTCVKIGPHLRAVVQIGLDLFAYFSSIILRCQIMRLCSILVNLQGGEAVREGGDNTKWSNACLLKQAQVCDIPWQNYHLRCKILSPMHSQFPPASAEMLVVLFPFQFMQCICNACKSSMLANLLIAVILCLHLLQLGVRWPRSWVTLHTAVLTDVWHIMYLQGISISVSTPLDDTAESHMAGWNFSYCIHFIITVLWGKKCTAAWRDHPEESMSIFNMLTCVLLRITPTRASKMSSTAKCLKCVETGR